MRIKDKPYHYWRWWVSMFFMWPIVILVLLIVLIIIGMKKTGYFLIGFSERIEGFRCEPLSNLLDRLVKWTFQESKK